MLTQDEDEVDLSNPAVQLAILREQARRNVYHLGRARFSLELAITKMDSRQRRLERQRTDSGVSLAELNLGRSKVWVASRRLNLSHCRKVLDTSKADIQRLLAS